jgi:hypothetical protein
MAKKTTKVNAKVKEAADKILKLFGQDGKHWLSGTESDDEGNYCLIGGLEQLGYSQELFDDTLPVCSIEANDDGTVEPFTFESTPDFNDRDGWAPIKTFLKLLKKGINPSNIFIDEDGNAKVLEVKTIKV